MIRLKKLGHIQLRVADLERSKAFYRDVLGFRVAEQDPKHGDLFMTLGEDFHTLDMAPHESPETARGPARPLGVAHIAFQVASYEALGRPIGRCSSTACGSSARWTTSTSGAPTSLTPTAIAWKSTTRCRARSRAFRKVAATRTASYPSAAWESRCRPGSSNGGPVVSPDHSFRNNRERAPLVVGNGPMTQAFKPFKSFNRYASFNPPSSSSPAVVGEERDGGCNGLNGLNVLNPYWM